MDYTQGLLNYISNFDFSIIDLIIPVGAILPMWLSLQKDNHKLQRMSPVVGLLFQPFWFYESFTNQQMGLIITTVIFTGVYIQAIKRYWFDVTGYESRT